MEKERQPEPLFPFDLKTEPWSAPWWAGVSSSAGFSSRQLRSADVTKLQKHSAQDSWKMKRHLYSPPASMTHIFVADLQYSVPKKSHASSVSVVYRSVSLTNMGVDEKKG